MYIYIYMFIYICIYMYIYGYVSKYRIVLPCCSLTSPTQLLDSHSFFSVSYVCTHTHPHTHTHTYTHAHGHRVSVGAERRLDARSPSQPQQLHVRSSLASFSLSRSLSHSLSLSLSLRPSQPQQLHVRSSLASFSLSRSLSVSRSLPNSLFSHSLALSLSLALYRHSTDRVYTDRRTKTQGRQEDTDYHTQINSQTCIDRQI